MHLCSMKHCVGYFITREIKNWKANKMVVAALSSLLSELACGYINLSAHITSAALSVCSLAPDGHVGLAVSYQSQINLWMDFSTPCSRVTTCT